MNPLQILFGGDAVSKVVALALLLMSLSSWLIILWRGWLLRRFAQALPVAVDAFWCSPGVVEGAAKLARMDRLGLIANMVAAASSVGSQKDQGGAGYAIPERLRLTRVLRSGLRMAVRRLQWGQVWLATVGSTAPFVGLLGTVWSIYHAMQGLVGGGGASGSNRWACGGVSGDDGCRLSCGPASRRCLQLAWPLGSASGAGS